jgi:hypothetical protein
LLLGGAHQQSSLRFFLARAPVQARLRRRELKLSKSLLTHFADRANSTPNSVNSRNCKLSRNVASKARVSISPKESKLQRKPDEIWTIHKRRSRKSLAISSFLSKILQRQHFNENSMGVPSRANTQCCRSLKSKAERKHPDAYAKASRKYDY